MEQPRIFYIANMRFPTERAHGIQVAKMCEAFARHGASVTLLVPDRETIPEDPFSYYGTLRNFSIEKIPVPDVVRFGKLGFFTESFVFARLAAKRMRNEPDALVYTREELPLFFLPRQGAFYEAHQLRRSLFFRLLLKRAKGIISISQGLKDALIATGYPGGKILVARDGYDEKQFAERVPKAEARKRLELPQDRSIAMYIGGLEAWKGAETLCKAAALLVKDEILVVIIGGVDEEIRKFRADYPEVLFLGSHPYRELPQNQQAADILIIPNSAGEEISRRFTSPLKLFAHMVSSRPIVASDLPSIREVLDDSNAAFFKPDSPKELAHAVASVLVDRTLAETLSQNALERATGFTWEKRAQAILDFLRG